jgi:hypothetical protein
VTHFAGFGQHFVRCHAFAEVVTASESGAAEELKILLIENFVGFRVLALEAFNFSRKIHRLTRQRRRRRRICYDLGVFDGGFPALNR